MNVVDYNDDDDDDADGDGGDGGCDSNELEPVGGSVFGCDGRPLGSLGGREKCSPWCVRTC